MDQTKKTETELELQKAKQHIEELHEQNLCLLSGTYITIVNNYSRVSIITVASKVKYCSVTFIGLLI